MVAQFYANDMVKKLKNAIINIVFYLRKLFSLLVRLLCRAMRYWEGWVQCYLEAEDDWGWHVHR